MEEEEEVTLKTKLQNILNEKSKLLPDVLKNGTTILGVTGILKPQTTIIEFNDINEIEMIQESGKNILVCTKNTISL